MASALDLYNQYVKDLDSNLNNYIGQQEGFGTKRRDLTLNNLNALNLQALGAQSPAEQAAFLASVLDPAHYQNGSIEYGYDTNRMNIESIHNNNSLGLAQNRQLALDKLANDEKWALNSIGLNQGKSNQQKIEELNSRGLLYGQAPTGGLKSDFIGGVSGIAGTEAGLVNNDYANQYGQLGATNTLQRRGINEQFDRQNYAEDVDSIYKTKMNKFNAANDVNAQNANYTFQSGTANNDLETYKAQLAQQKAQQSIQNKMTAQSIGARQGGITY